MGDREYALKFTSKSYEDIDEIYGYLALALQAGGAAENLMLKLESSIRRLKLFPQSGSPVLEEVLRRKGYRKLLVDNYIVFYLIDEEGSRVIIMRILYGAMNYQGIF
jgi:addiction module RelE/StbE family toxin